MDRGDDGSDARPLSKDKQSLFVSPSWAPDGEYVLVSRQPQLPWGRSTSLCITFAGGQASRLPRARPSPMPRAMTTCIRSEPSRRETASTCITPSATSCSTPITTLIFHFPRSCAAIERPVIKTRSPGRRGAAFARSCRRTARSWSSARGVDNQTGLRIRDLATGEEALAQAAGAA